MTEKHEAFYLCSVCFRTSTEAETCHNHPMHCCDTGRWGDECRKPLMTASGRLLTRAPRWWLQHRSELTRIN